MKNNEMNDGLNELIEKLIKSTGARTIKHKELENLGSAVETIKECVSKDKLIGYIAIGVSNTGEVVNATVGSKFAIYEMINLLFEAVAKIDTDLGREILEKLKSNFEEIKTSKSEDEKGSDNDCDEDDEDDTKKEIAKKLKKIFSKLKRDKDAEKLLKGEVKIRKKGDWWDKHIEEQAEMLEKLRARGYRAEFGVGFDGCKKIIDNYLRN